MKRKRLVIISISFLAVVILGAVVWPREREPVYNGVPLSEWLRRFNDDEPQSREAIQRIGTNALPHLVGWIQYEPPAWGRSLNCLHGKLPSSIQKIALLRLLFRDKAELRAELAVEAFWALRAEGTSATDQLLQLALAKNTHAPATQRRARECLMNMASCLPPEAVYDLLKR